MGVGQMELDIYVTSNFEVKCYCIVDKNEIRLAKWKAISINATWPFLLREKKLRDLLDILEIVYRCGVTNDKLITWW
jgi:hypothetical protein